VSDDLDLRTVPDDLTPLPHVDLPPAQKEKPREGRGCLPYLFGGMGCAAFIVVIVIALIVATGGTLASVIGSVGGLLGAQNWSAPPSAEVISSQTIVQGIQPLGQLVSISAQLAKAGVFVGVGQGVLNACGYSANHAVQGAVEAGIDLTQITADDVVYDARRGVWVLTLPAPQLTSCRIDMIDQYDQSFSTCNPDWDGVRQLASYTALTDFRNDAVEGGILTRAESETRLVLGNFVRLLTGHPVEIQFEQPESPIIPPSCSPALPRDWYWDTANGHWSK
jgi:hypothetical protein